MTYTSDYKPAGPGTKGMAITALVLSGVAALSGGLGGGILGNLLGNPGGGCAWSAKEVFLLEEINKVKTEQAVTAAVTPYQIDKATCKMVEGELFLPSTDVAYMPHHRGFRGI